MYFGLVLEITQISSIGCILEVVEDVLHNIHAPQVPQNAFMITIAHRPPTTQEVSIENR